MKFTEKDKPVKTIPKGVWESSRPGGHTVENKNSDTVSSAGIQKNRTTASPKDKQQ